MYKKFYEQKTVMKQKGKIKNKLLNGIFIVTLALLFCSPIISGATPYYNTNSKTVYYASVYYMTCKSNMSGNKATASTEANSSPYYNYVSLTTYNSNNKIKYSNINCKTNNKTVSLSYSSSSTYKYISGHMICDANKKALDSLKNTITLTNYK